MNEKNEPEIKVVSPIDGGHLYDEIDYYVAEFADLESENENGEKNKLPDILKLYFKNYVHCKDTDVGTILTEDDIKHLNDKENDDNDDNYDECDAYTEYHCEKFYNK
jgi:hypothetical protein